jgi:flavin-dependent dehydrogenase
MVNQHYDVIIIGGRCAGSSLTLWLAGNNLKILLVDRATFPSLPSVPSSPFIYPCTLRLLDELGFKETDYTLPGSKIERFVIEFVNYFHAEMPTSRMMLDRNYCYGLDRNVFDQALWQRATQVPGVTAYEGFSVTEIIKNEVGAVTGIVGKTAAGKREQYTAVPGFALKTIVRWVLHDPDYQTEYLQYLSRAIPPAAYRISPPISPRIIFNGIMGDIRQRFRGQ